MALPCAARAVTANAGASMNCVRFAPNAGRFRYSPKTTGAPLKGNLGTAPVPTLAGATPSHGHPTLSSWA
eukprot:3306046-Pyramimonas_sp.AAC.1